MIKQNIDLANNYKQYQKMKKESKNVDYQIETAKIVNNRICDKMEDHKSNIELNERY